MNDVVISGIGFATPAGCGSSLDDLDWNQPRKLQTISTLENGRDQLIHCRPPDLSTHPDYPDRKQLRTMREESILAYISAISALENAGLDDFDHTETAFYLASGQCFYDMWSYLKPGIMAAEENGKFSFEKFGKFGIRRMYPFYVLRTLSALPIALISQKYGIRGDNAVTSSFGAESAEAVEDGFRAIQSGLTNIALVGGLDNLSEPFHISNLRNEHSLNGDIHLSMSASFVVLEEKSHCLNRGQNYHAELLDVRTSSDSFSYKTGFSPDKNIFETVTTELSSDQISDFVLGTNGIRSLYETEMQSATEVFPNSAPHCFFEAWGSLMASSEPMGLSLLCFLCQNDSVGVSLSRSILGKSAAISIRKEGE